MWRAPLVVSLVGICAASDTVLGSWCNPSNSTSCEDGLRCTCGLDLKGAKGDRRRADDSEDSTNNDDDDEYVPFIEKDLPDLGQGLKGLTAAGKTYFATEFRQMVINRRLLQSAEGFFADLPQSAEVRRLLMHKDDGGCRCMTPPSLDLSESPVFQVGLDGFGTAKPVDRISAGADANPNWDNCEHCKRHCTFLRSLCPFRIAHGL